MRDHIPPSEILSRAVELLLRDGWSQGSYYHQHGQTCMVGALHKACYGGPLGVPTYNQELSKKWAYRYLEDAIDPGNPDTVDVEGWNDAPERRLNEVIEVLRQAWILAKEKGE